MRYVSLVVVVLLLVAFGGFAVVNREPVQVHFPLIEVQLGAPLFLVMLGVYVLGMLTGGTFFGFVRQSIERASDRRNRRR